MVQVRARSSLNLKKNVSSKRENLFVCGDNLIQAKKVPLVVYKVKQKAQARLELVSNRVFSDLTHPYLECNLYNLSLRLIYDLK